MTDETDLYKFKALLLPWDARNIEDLSAAILGNDWGTAWYDGDTFSGLVSRGARDYGWFHIRCAGYNSPEINRAATKAAAEAAREYAASLVDTGGIVYLDSLAFEVSAEEDNFGRLLAKVTVPGGIDLASAMIGSGNAVPDP